MTRAALIARALRPGSTSTHHGPRRWPALALALAALVAVAGCERGGLGDQVTLRLALDSREGFPAGVRLVRVAVSVDGVEQPAQQDSSQYDISSPRVYTVSAGRGALVEVTAEVLGALTGDPLAGQAGVFAYAGGSSFTVSEQDQVGLAVRRAAALPTELLVSLAGAPPGQTYRLRFIDLGRAFPLPDAYAVADAGSLGLRWQGVLPQGRSLAFFLEDQEGVPAALVADPDASSDTSCGVVFTTSGGQQILGCELAAGAVSAMQVTVCVGSCPVEPPPPVPEEPRCLVDQALLAQRSLPVGGCVDPLDAAGPTPLLALIQAQLDGCTDGDPLTYCPQALYASDGLATYDAAAPWCAPVQPFVPQRLDVCDAATELQDPACCTPLVLVPTLAPGTIWTVAGGLPDAYTLPGAAWSAGTPADLALTYNELLLLDGDYRRLIALDHGGQYIRSLAGRQDRYAGDCPGPTAESCSLRHGRELAFDGQSLYVNDDGELLVIGPAGEWRRVRWSEHPWDFGGTTWTIAAVGAVPGRGTLRYLTRNYQDSTDPNYYRLFCFDGDSDGCYPFNAESMKTLAWARLASFHDGQTWRIATLEHQQSQWGSDSGTRLCLYRAYQPPVGADFLIDDALRGSNALPLGCVMLYGTDPYASGWGCAPATTAEDLARSPQQCFDAPASLAYGPDGSLYLADPGNLRIVRVAPPQPYFDGTSHALCTVAASDRSGMPGFGPCADRFISLPDHDFYPRALAFAPDATRSLYVAYGSSGQRLARLDLDSGVVAYLQGALVDGLPAPERPLGLPAGLAYDPASDSLLVADQLGELLRVGLADRGLEVLAGDRGGREASTSYQAVEPDSGCGYEIPGPTQPCGLRHRLAGPLDVSRAPDGSLYLAASGRFAMVGGDMPTHLGYVYRLSGGTLDVVAGGPQCSESQLGYAPGVDLARDLCPDLLGEYSPSDEAAAPWQLPPTLDASAALRRAGALAADPLGTGLGLFLVATASPDTPLRGLLGFDLPGLSAPATLVGALQSLPQYARGDPLLVYDGASLDSLWLASEHFIACLPPDLDGASLSWIGCRTSNGAPLVEAGLPFSANTETDCQETPNDYAGLAFDVVSNVLVVADRGQHHLPRLRFTGAGCGRSSYQIDVLAGQRPRLLDDPLTAWADARWSSSPGFAGDLGPAGLAAVNAPADVVFVPARPELQRPALWCFADSGNHRVRCVVDGG